MEGDGTATSGHTVTTPRPAHSTARNESLISGHNSILPGITYTDSQKIGRNAPRKVGYMPPFRRPAQRNPFDEITGIRSDVPPRSCLSIPADAI